MSVWQLNTHNEMRYVPCLNGKLGEVICIMNIFFGNFELQVKPTHVRRFNNKYEITHC